MLPGSVSILYSLCVCRVCGGFCRLRVQSVLDMLSSCEAEAGQNCGDTRFLMIAIMIIRSLGIRPSEALDALQRLSWHVFCFRFVSVR